MHVLVENCHCLSFDGELCHLCSYTWRYSLIEQHRTREVQVFREVSHVKRNISVFIRLLEAVECQCYPSPVVTHSPISLASIDCAHLAHFIDFHPFHRLESLMLAFRNVCTSKRKSDLLFVIPRGDLLDAYCVAVLDPGLNAGTARTWRCRAMHKDAGDGTLVERQIREVDFQDIHAPVCLIGRVERDFSIEDYYVVTLVVLKDNFTSSEVVSCCCYDDCSCLVYECTCAEYFDLVFPSSRSV